MKKGNAQAQGLSREDLEPLVTEGLTIEKIARRLSVSDSTAKKWLKRYGLRTQVRSADSFSRICAAKANVR